MSGYVYNLIVTNVWDASFLSQILGLIGVFSLFILPASLVILPAARWSIQTPGWQRKSRPIQIVFLSAGTILAVAMYLTRSLWEHLVFIPDGWFMPLLLWIVPSYLLSFNTGLLMGQRAYWSMGFVSAIPQIGRPLLLAIALLLGMSGSPMVALWVLVAAVWLGTVYGSVRIAQLHHRQESAVSLPVSLGATGMSSLVVNIWLTWDIAVAYLVLEPEQMAVYSIVSSLGKMPFYLASHVANMGINESAVKGIKVFKVNFLILLIGIVCSLGAVICGDFLMGMFKVSTDISVFIWYLIANTVLAMVYFIIGIEAQSGRHMWISTGVCAAVWTAYSLARKPDLNELIIALFVALLLSLVLTIALVRGVQRLDVIRLLKNKQDVKQ
ncbi:hypothetical protein ACFFSY_13550 [Paenibacillus aurantiacus]|uniref:Uncharacterized protein n=2 Tax=Paenibacillus aurantiacus TaxID=1936118 RepID=A0ABV5KS51_9BACL